MTEAFFKSLLVLSGPLLLWSGATAEEQPVLAEKQVVLVTDLGEIVLELFPDVAPQHVQHFQERIRNGFYIGTTFHRAILYGIIQGGDPLTKDPAKRDQYGSGGLRELQAEFSDVSNVRGTVSAVLIPGEPNSGGSQFFICVTDQVQLDGQYTAFGRVVGGMAVVEKISAMATDEQQRLTERVEIKRTFERDRPPPLVIPFVNTPVEELKDYSVVVKTNLGELEISFFPEAAPEHVRQFLRFAELGLYNGTQFHRVVPDFVVQGGSLSTRSEPIPEKLAGLVKPLKGEFNDIKHIRGIVSMARGDDPNSAIDSFFVVLSPQPALDGKYTVFGQVIRGIDTVDGISQVPVQGEKPIMPVSIELMTVRRVDTPAREH